MEQKNKREENGRKGIFTQLYIADTLNGKRDFKYSI